MGKRSSKRMGFSWRVDLTSLPTQTIPKVDPHCSQGYSMYSTVSSQGSRCQHSEQSTCHSILKKGKTRKPPEDDEAIKPVECTSNVASGERPLGFMKYLKRCFQLRSRGNSFKKLRSKTVKASEAAEISTVSEVNHVDSASIPPHPASVLPESLDSTCDPVNSIQYTVSSPDLVHSPSPHGSPNPSKPDSCESNQSGTSNMGNNTQKSLTVELLNLSKYGWYWGPITQAEAVEKLQDQPDGSFLIRDSYADHFLVSMSFKTLGRIHHTRINYANGQFFFYSSSQHSFSSIHELIEVSMDSSKSSIFCYSTPYSLSSPSLPIRLTRPVSRFTEVRSLQHLCRFVIRQYTRIDRIKELPLPNKLCGYLEAKPF